MKKITIILPVYNSEKYISETITSILEQTYINYELIIINDGSIDNSEKICREFEKNDDRIKVLTQVNSGVSVARNLGLKHMSGEYVTFIDSDDKYQKNFLEMMVTSLEKYNSDILICGYNTISKKNKSIRYGNDLINIGLNECIEKLQPLVLTNQLWNKLYKVEIIKKNMITFDKNIDLGEDYRFNLLYLKEIQKITYIDNCLYYYRISNIGLGFKYRKDSAKIKLENLAILEKEYEKRNYNKEYIFFYYLKQYISNYNNITSLKNKDSIGLKIGEIKNFINDESYKIKLKEIQNINNIKLKIISKLIEKNVFSCLLLGVISGIYDKFQKIRYKM